MDTAKLSLCSQRQAQKVPYDDDDGSRTPQQDSLNPQYWSAFLRGYMANNNSQSISKMTLPKGGDVDTRISPSTINSAATSTSYPSSLSPGPSTPPSRRTRYQDIGRVPLHRRGTSKTYERLEDLLKEAGYKETRVFTPETDRAGVANDKPSGGMGTVVDFFSHFFPAGHSRPDRTEDSQSRPSSPSQLSPTSSYNEPTPRPKRHVSEAKYRLQQTYQKYAPLDQVTHQPKAMPPPESPLAHPRPSRAGAYLRHMASTASISHPRPSSTPARSQPLTTRRKRITDDDDDPSIIFNRKGNGEGEEDHHGQPPLPPTWLETVARAVLFGGTGAYIGGPPIQSRKQSQVLRPSRSSLSQVSAKPPSNGRSGLSDQTNLLLTPPPLVTMLERGRAGRSESQVTRTQVVCRSAPGSRAPSLVRRDSERSRGRAEHRLKKQGPDRHRVPSLARTQTEDDAWNNGKARPSTANGVKHLYLTGAESDVLGGGTSEEEDEDHEGELDLARMLLHPKRQNSIRSLRKHLNGTDGANTNRYTRPPASPLRDDEDWPYEQEQWGSGWAKRGGAIADADEDEEAETFARFIGTHDSRRSGGSQSRSKLPTWGQRS